MREAWGWLLFTHARVLRALEADMLEHHELPITWFDILNRLREAPGQRLRLHELEDASLFTKSGLTRLVDRIEEAGYVRRERSLEDRRGVYVVVTNAGNEKINEIWADHVDSINRHFGQYLDLEDADAIKTAGQKVFNGDPVPTAVPGSRSG